MKNKKILFMVVGFVTVFSLASLLPNFVFADSNYGLDSTAQSAGLPMSKDLSSVLGNIIGSALSMIAVLFFGLMLYGGITWMVARGKSENTQKALDTIIAAIIGIVIIMAAYAITNFVFSSVKAGAGGPTMSPNIPDAPKTCSANSDCPSGQGMICSSGSCIDDPITGFCLLDTGTSCGLPINMSDFELNCSGPNVTPHDNYNDCLSLLNTRLGGCASAGCLITQRCDSSTNKCVDKLTEGLTCDPSNNYCANNLYCLAQGASGSIDPESEFTCSQLRKENQYCRPGTTQAYCESQYACIDNKCKPREAGTPCGTNEQCGQDNFCVDTVCQTGAVGADCSDISHSIGDDQCDSGLYCENAFDGHSCQTKLANGEDCDRNSMCLNNFCNSGKCANQF
ncbi:MAG: Dickkopf N-terminal cysteine-rich domain-containing protein [Candidatus Magasanikbacteria bacterium]